MPETIKSWTFPVASLEGNYDGDTITVVLDLGFHTYMKHAVRLEGVDTPELRGGDEPRRALARMARDEAARWLEAGIGNGLYFHCTAFAGKYGRPIGDFLARRDDGGTIKLSEHLIAERLGVPYAGGSRSALQEQHARNAEFHQAGGRG